MKPLAQNTLIQSRYLIVQLIGKGGMGEVYLAVDQRLGSAVAIKRTFFAGDEMLGNAFEREARVLARLRHPVLPKVSDHFTENDQQFLVMEHISGEDLAKRLEALQKPFPLSWVMFWADQLLDALSYLHSHEPPIIHRDIKPQNLKLTDENHIVLLDFGLSKSSTGQTNLASGVNQTGSTGSVVGYTPHYAPMEQIRGIGTNPRSDLYSLSATIYQLMTNVVPADALTRADVMLNAMPDPITPIHELNPEVPPGVSSVVLRGMEVSQDKRFDTAREMQKTLRKAFAEMQQAMSAKTVAISGSEAAAAGLSQPSSFEATEVMDPEALRAISNPVGGSQSGFSENISQPTSPHSNLDATVAFDPSSVSGSSGLRQADVKTEVFNLGDSLPVAPVEDPQPYVSDPTPPPAPQENFALTTDYSSIGAGAAETYVPADESYAADASAANLALQSNGAAAVSGTSQFSGYQQPEAAPTGFDSRPQENRAAVVQAAPAKKGSTGKIVALLGGLFVFFVIVLGAAGGGYYYYTNYMGVAAVPTPSPSPMPTVEPTPAPTSESVFTDNSNTATPSPSPAATPEPTATPAVVTPVDPQVDRPDTRPTPGATKPTPRPRPSTTVKPAPTKKPGGRDPDILQ
jgi:serine/threonine protein kinase